MKPARFVLYSDYLCPWCFNASVRWEQVERETAGSVELEWRSYLLRPEPRPGRSLEKFRSYTRSWQRVGAEPDAGSFQLWQGEAGPPSHSIPPQLAAKAAARVGDDAFRRMHRRLLEAYFSESRDISDHATLESLWSELSLPTKAFGDIDDPELEAQVVAEHREALALGATGVPAARLADEEALITGALPIELYRRWVRRALES